jgi:hypothetical protein
VPIRGEFRLKARVLLALRAQINNLVILGLGVGIIRQILVVNSEYNLTVHKVSFITILTFLDMGGAAAAGNDGTPD